jgi:hypothetical protein
MPDARAWYSMAVTNIIYNNKSKKCVHESRRYYISEVYIELLKVPFIKKEEG